MELTGSYRHELKYQISPADYHALRQRLRAVMKRDPHTLADGLYTIRSVYFDNYRDKALREKVDGVQRREKFRIRYYNDDFSFITLEKKIKHNDLCMKLDATLTAGEYRRLLQTPGPWMLEHLQPLVRELYCKMNTQQLRPRVLVSYVREPYIYDAGNVRVTFGSHILVMNCADEIAENAVLDILGSDTEHYIVKSKTITASGIELTAELRTKNASTAFVNSIAQLPGVENATLVSYNGEYLTAADTLYQVVKLRGQSIQRQLDGTIPSTQSAQRTGDALVDASALDLSAMGYMNNGGAGGFDGGNAPMETADEESAAPPQSSTEPSDGFDPSQFGGAPPGGFAPAPSDGNNTSAAISAENLTLYGISLLIIAAALLFAVLYRRRPRNR